MRTDSLAQADAGTTGSAPASIRSGAAASASRLAHFEQATPGRERVEAFVRSEFVARFDARPGELMPQLVALHDRTGAITGAAGYRSAGESRLFLETYTQQSIEDVIAARFGDHVPRARIAEVGNLATKGGRSALQLVAALLPMLIERNFSWVVFTGARQVRNLFQRLHLLPYAICIADKSLLGNEQHVWGTYYDHHPIVMAGRLRDGISAIEATTALLSGTRNPVAVGALQANEARP